MGPDRAQLGHYSQGIAGVESDALKVVADLGYYDCKKIQACEEGDHRDVAETNDLGREGAGSVRQADCAYLSANNTYRARRHEIATYRFTAEEHGQRLAHCLRRACRTCGRQCRARRCLQLASPRRDRNGAPKAPAN